MAKSGMIADTITLSRHGVVIGTCAAVPVSSRSTKWLATCALCDWVHEPDVVGIQALGEHIRRKHDETELLLPAPGTAG